MMHHSTHNRAAGGNHIEIMTYLMDKGAVVDQTDKSGRTALHWAVISGHKEATDILLGKVNSRGRSKCLQPCVAPNNRDGVD